MIWLLAPIGVVALAVAAAIGVDVIASWFDPRGMR